MTLPDELSAIAFEHAPIGLVVTESRVIKGCNPAFAQMFGYSVEQLLEQSFAMLYPSIEEFERIATSAWNPSGAPTAIRTSASWPARMARCSGAGCADTR